MSVLDLVQSFVLCEEVRLEATGKHVLVGATGNGLAIPELPSRIAVAFYLELRVPQMGEKAFDLRLRMSPSNELVMSLVVNRVESSHDDIITVFTPRFDSMVTAEGELTVDIREKGGEWFNLTRRPLVLQSPAPERS